MGAVARLLPLLFLFMALLKDLWNAWRTGDWSSVQNWANSTGKTVLNGLSDRYLGTNFLATDAAEKNWDQIWSMWNATNQYNSPANQMQLIRDAGLNPNLVTGGSFVGTSSPVSGFAEASGANGSGSLVRDISEGALLRSQIDNIDSQTELNKKRSGQTEQEINQLKIKNALLQFQHDAVKDGVEEGLYNRAVKAGMFRDIFGADIAQGEAFSAIWDMLVKSTPSDSRNFGVWSPDGDGNQFFFTPSGSQFYFDKSTLEKAKDLFKLSQSTDELENELAQARALYDKANVSSDDEFISFLMAHQDEWWSKLIRGARWVLGQFGAPSFSYSKSSSSHFRSKNYSTGGSKSRSFRFN